MVNIWNVIWSPFSNTAVIENASRLIFTSHQLCMYMLLSLIWPTWQNARQHCISILTAFIFAWVVLEINYWCPVVTIWLCFFNTGPEFHRVCDSNFFRKIATCALISILLCFHPVWTSAPLTFGSMYVYPIIIFGVDISFFANKVFHNFRAASSFSCHMQGSHLMERRNYKSKLNVSVYKQIFWPHRHYTMIRLVIVWVLLVL